MIISLDKHDLIHYTSYQLNHFFPDKNEVRFNNLSDYIDLTLDRIDFCFQHVILERYVKSGETLFNHLYTDHYLMYLWFLSNTVWKENGDIILASKLYYLNKSLHGFDCMYDTDLPNIFLISHGVGTVLGKASYSDFLVVLQGCTVGSNRGSYPVLGKGVSLTANSSIIGNCKVGNRSTISTRTCLYNRDLPNDCVAYFNTGTGSLEIKHSTQAFSQQVFNFKRDMSRAHDS